MKTPETKQTTSESPSCDAACSPGDIINGLLHAIDDHPCCRASLYAAANLIAQLEQERDDAIGQLAMGEENMGHAYDELRKERDAARRDLMSLMDEYADRRAQWGDEYLWMKHEDTEIIEDIRRRILSENDQVEARRE